MKYFYIITILALITALGKNIQAVDNKPKIYYTVPLADAKINPELSNKKIFDNLLNYIDIIKYQKTTRKDLNLNKLIDKKPLLGPKDTRFVYLNELLKYGNQTLGDNLNTLANTSQFTDINVFSQTFNQFLNTLQILIDLVNDVIVTEHSSYKETAEKIVKKWGFFIGNIRSLIDLKKSNTELKPGSPLYKNMQEIAQSLEKIQSLYKELDKEMQRIRLDSKKRAQQLLYTLIRNYEQTVQHAIKLSLVPHNETETEYVVV
jgi:hypothetical protein